MTSREKIFAFANKHGILFVEKGECGFGRPCVGLNRGDGSWLDYNPLSDTTYGPIFPYDSRLCAPEGVDAYHKHDCFAVLVSDDNYESAIDQLEKWIEHLEAQGELEVVSFKTGASGIQAIISGVNGKALKFKEPTPDNAKEDA